MSGVAKDDTNPTVPEETAPAAGDAEAGHVEASQADASSTESELRSRRPAPHLRVVSDNGDLELAGPAHEQTPSGFAPGALDLPGQRIGAIIRATRENLGYSLEQVSKETRVHLSHLRAIEDMTPNLLGAPVYAKGYIRSYARHLGLDENATLERYLRECAILKDPEKQTIAPPSTGRKLPVAVPVFGFLIVALAGAAAAFFLMNGGEQLGSPKIASAAPDRPAPGIAAPPAQSSVADVVPAVQQQLRIVAVRRGRIEIRSAAGDKYVDRVFEPGQSFPVRVGYGWTVTAREDGSAFEWRLGDQSLGLLTAEGPAYSQSVDLAAKRPPIDPPPPVADTTEPVPVVDTEPTAPSTPPSRSATVSPPPAASPTTSPAPSGPPGSRIAAPPAASAGAPPKPKAPKPQPQPKQAEIQPPVVATNPPPAGQLPTAAPVTPAQDPALLAYPSQ